MSSSPRFGYHPSIDRGYLSAIERSLDLGCSAVQIWVGNSKGYASRLIPKNEYAPVATLVKERSVFLISHSPYILNFARPLQSEPAGMKQLERYVRDLQNIQNLGGIGSVLHMGSNVAALGQSIEQAYQNFADNLRWVADRTSATLILENMAGGGTQMGKTLAELTEFWDDYIDSKLATRVKFCIDTAHLFAAGEYNISNPDECKRFYKDFDRLIGWEHVICFHFNGSKSKFASHKDQHDDIGSGHLSVNGLKQIAKIASKTNKPLILEVPVESITLIDQFEMINSW